MPKADSEKTNLTVQLVPLTGCELEERQKVSVNARYSKFEGAEDVLLVKMRVKTLAVLFV